MMTITRAQPPRALDTAQAQYFHTNGFVVLRGFLARAELQRLRAATAWLIERAHQSPPLDDPYTCDFAYAPGHDSGQAVLRRIEYVVQRLPECRALLGHPALLRGVEDLIGADLIPTWDSMVLKMPGEGIAVPWHRDAPSTQVGAHPIFNVDFYLDAAEGDTALRVLPGSHRWSDADAETRLRELHAAPQRSGGVPVNSADGFADADATLVTMQPGDVLLHDILLLHGSPPSRGNALRRVIYFEFRSARVELERGPHTPDYVPLKQQILAACIEQRRTGAEPGEAPYRYAPPTPFNRFPSGAPPTFRVPHAQYWRG
jgi:ectoine hydroxylase-related dioxygenase (phytanoyl-CoA dioxygenase family)